MGYFWTKRIKFSSAVMPTKGAANAREYDVLRLLLIMVST